MSVGPGPLPGALAAALADRYRVERELGRGGMATVYLARDLRHDRQVAIKVLHEDLGATLGPERFLAEIKTTAKLQHPHILPLLDSGEAGGLLFYVMPYVEGETLRSRLTRETQLPIEDAVRIAREVADALGFAHGHGIVHRDIKPENILLQGGHALVADFGIALAVQQAGGTRLTQTGLSLGTPQYMSPEQAMGDRTVDHRSDIYALGAVTYEMLTGDPPFTGSSVQAIVAKVLSSEPERLTTTRRTIPPNIEAAVLTALAKLPADRWTSAMDFATALLASGPVAGSSGASREVAARGVPGFWRPAAIIGVLASAALAVLFARERAVDGDTVVRRLSIVLPDSMPLALVGEAPLRIGRRSLALSPDGRTLVYVGWYRGRTHLFVRPIDDDGVRRLDGTEGAYSPFFSPDGRWVAFFAQHTLRKVALDGGTPVDLASAPEAYGGAWLAAGRILFAKDEGGTPSIVGENGGAVQRAAIGVASNPSPLPDRRHVVAIGGAGGMALWAADDSVMLVLTNDGFGPKARAPEPRPAASAQFLRGGFLLATFAGRLHALPFSEWRLEPRGSEFALDELVREEAMGVAAQFSVADDGTLVYVPGTAINESVLVIAERSGELDTLPLERGFYINPAFSPDGRRVAVTVMRGRQIELLVHDLDDGGTLAAARSATWIVDPLWEPSGERLLVSGPPWSPGHQITYEVRATGGALVERASVGGSLLGISKDGSWMAVAERNRGTPVLQHNGKPAGELPSPGGWVEFSPDNRFVLWSAVGSGGYEILVSALPPGGPVFNVTPQGCLEAKWMPSSAEIVCFQSDGLLYAVPLRIDDREVRGGAPRRLTRDPLLETSGRTWSLSPDGNRMLFVATPPGDSVRVLNVVTNFHELVRRKAAASVP